LLRLATRAKNEIHYHIKFLAAKFRLMVLERLAIAKNFFSVFGCVGLAPMKDSDAMAVFLERGRRERANETAAADKKDFHICILNCPGLKPDSLKSL
jgi:hypothetical protein